MEHDSLYNMQLRKKITARAVLKKNGMLEADKETNFAEIHDIDIEIKEIIKVKRKRKQKNRNCCDPF